MSNVPLSELIEHGNQLLALLEQGDMLAADKLTAHYLSVLDGVFQHIELGTALNVEQQQALLQFQTIHDWVEKAKHLTEQELLQFSKAGRASDLYKLNAG
ncbi:hypothetical protein [Aeromonas bestiarum]|uniref:hypothetical protein n=1 Tax=Aeromonas bestiarum TaxID=105751 RepID=UPI0005025752|nr:hypothetical protein [Aeromonas bestiarum]KFN19688.1 hypothetical protein JM66_08800 [Aeromonas bestiarum]